MNKAFYFAAFVASCFILGLGTLFLCAAVSLPERWPLAVVLLLVGLAGAVWSALAYGRWYQQQPAVLGSRITDLAAQNDGEISLAQLMAALNVPASVVTAALDDLQQKGQCHMEPRGEQTLYIFPGLKERKMVRKCVYCGSTFPVREPLQKCPHCGGNLDMVKQ